MDGMGWDGMGWDGMGWDGMGWDGMGWDGMGWDGMGWDGWIVPPKKKDHTRWAPTSYKWSYKPYKLPYKWVTGVITPFITSRGPTLQ